MVKCGNCKLQHETAADVRACYEHARGQDDSVPESYGDTTFLEGRNSPAASPSQPEPWFKSDEGPWWYGNGGKELPFPAGRYAILTPDEGEDGKLHFFHVDAPDEGRWKGYVFVKEQASDNLYPVKGRRGARVIEWIAEDPETAMLTYGRELGKCGHCGRTLTDEESRARGIGPICAGKVSF